MAGQDHRESSIQSCDRVDKQGTKSIKQARFLDHLGATSNVSESARKAGVTASQMYRLRRRDPEFASQWLAALWEGYTHLEMEVLCRLRDGNLQAEDGSKYDFANAIRLLFAHRDNAAKAQSEKRNVTPAQVRASIDRKVEAIRKQVRSLAKRTAGPPAGRPK